VAITKLSTIGKDGEEYHFTYELEEQYDRINDVYKICFKTVLNGVDKKKWFDFKVAPIGEDILKVTDMFDFQKIYKGKGLPETLILEAQKRFPEKQVISSSNRQKIFKNEWRSDAGSAVWERLVQSGKAEYSAEKDVYKLKK
jgi:hypothetical protein